MATAAATDERRPITIYTKRRGPEPGATLAMTTSGNDGRPSEFSRLIRELRDCRLCEAQLPAGPRPVFQLHPSARVLVAAQAPGSRVHRSGIPFDDPSGERLRAWMGISKRTFYDAERIAILPMGLCYPGRGRSGDLPPRPECAETWRRAVLDALPRIELTLVIGRYAVDWHLPGVARNLTETVRAWRDLRPSQLPLPHPSPRNNAWLARHPWFEAELLPYLRRRVKRALS